MRSAIEPEPVLVECQRGQKTVRVRPVFRVDAETYAIVESLPWEDAGSVWQSSMQVENARGTTNLRTVWRGVTTGGTKVQADTKPKAIEALLEARDEFAVTIEQTARPLFNLEEPKPELVQIDVDDQGNEIWGHV